MKLRKFIFLINFAYWFYPNRSKIASNCYLNLQQILLPHCCEQIHCALTPQAPTRFVSNFGVSSRFRLSLQTNWVTFPFALLVSPFCNICCKLVHILLVFEFAFSIISFLLLSFSFSAISVNVLHCVRSFLDLLCRVVWGFSSSLLCCWSFLASCDIWKIC